jgi:adenosine deaminase
VISSELLRRLPKAELHCHLDGSLRPATLYELAAEYGIAIPASSVEELAAYMQADDARDLDDYLRRFELTISVMQTEAALERVAYELVEDAAADGVRYIEVRNAPILNIRNGLELAAALEASLRGFARAEAELGVTTRFIMCALRNLEPSVSLELARLAVAYKSQGVVAFDLAGSEAGNDAAPHGDAFRYAREHDLAVTVHAGEGAGSESVREAVHVCGADRIGHGTRLIEDSSLTQYVNDRRIPLEVCLTSNVQTRVAGSYESHPFREYFDRGLVVTLNTDNRLMSGTTLTDEYAHAVRALHFTWDEICQVASNGFASAFIPWQERANLLDDIRKEIEALVRTARASAQRAAR